jgi:murein DD-endopeptidase MepM/ murein hydrolase activator NlpD
MIFPTLKNKKGAEVNLNDLAKTWLQKHYKTFPDPSPLIDPLTCQEMLEEYYTEHALDYSYGGYLEDRSVIWRGNYLAKHDTYIHLGIDYNAPAGTPVALDMQAEVILVDDDTPLNGGWGPHVMFKIAHEPIVLLYAHLGDIACKAGQLLSPQERFAHVGAPNCNGRWHPHVHGQALTLETYEKYKLDIDALDGYCRAEDAGALRAEFPDPSQWIKAQ